MTSTWERPYRNIDKPARVQTIEEQIVRHMIAVLAEHGWTINGANDGERVSATTADEAVEVLQSVLESHLYFKSPSGKRTWVMLVNGNGFDVISDWGIHDGFCPVMEAICEWVTKEQDRVQP